MDGQDAAPDAASESERERRRAAYETLLNPAFDIGAFAGIARVVCQGLDCRAAGIGRVVAGSADIEVLGMWLDGATRPAFRYDTTGTPCATSLTMGDDVLIVEHSLAGSFSLAGQFTGLEPQSYCGVPLRDEHGANLGILFALDSRPRAADASTTALLRAASARATAELLRLRADERLRESEARMRFALDAGHLGMWEWDREADTWVWNERMAEMRGCAHDEVQLQYDDWHPDDEERLAPIRDDFMAGRIDSYEVEYRIRHRALGWRWINSRTRALRRAPDGRPLAMIGVQTDIHERRLAEDAARANQRWLQLVIDATRLGLWDWDAVTDSITWSPRCAELLGYALADMPVAAAGWNVNVHPDDQAVFRDAVRDHLRGLSQEVRVELRARARDGSWRWILSTGRVVTRDARGRALRCVGTWQDVTPLKQGELALRESEARLRTVVENSPVGIFLADATGSIVYFNPAIAVLSSPTTRDARGHAWLAYVHRDDRERMARSWRAFVAAPQGLFDAEWRAWLSGDVERRMRTRATAIRESGRVLGFAGALEDVTAQVAAAERERALHSQLQRAQKIEAIGTLTGGIAHDFNNSLATILGFATLAQGRNADDAKLGQYLATIVQAVEHSRDLVRKLLDFSRSTPAADLAPLDAATRVEEVAGMLQAVIPSTIRIATAIAPDVETVLMDATDFQQMLLNLALNARDASGAHGEIAIGLRAARQVRGHCAACLRDVDGEYVELTVRDAGTGIASDHLPRIFDPFYSTKDVGQGTGMGLAVLHGIVHRADGHVLVESTPGRGTTMRVLLRPGVAAEAAGGAPVGAPTPMLRALRALVVDDEPALARFLGEWLDAEGHAAERFTDPLAALAWARGDEANFDLLITDQTMPGMTGMELAQALREQRPRLPVIVCTGHAERIGAPGGATLGGLQVLLKPVPLEDLRAALGRAAAALD